MLDWTDRHCRALHRLISPHARLYTEMVSTGALLHGDVARHLRFHAAEQPLALQLGGSEPAELAHCARLGARWGYAEINLNCGCPSPRVQRGAFGACLMAEPQRVADCVRAMRDAVALPVTVKHRIGLDRQQDYSLVRDFVGAVAEAGCNVFIVHARSAWLEGLSPKENRELPPLRYDYAYQLKRDFPHLTVVVNGGIASSAQIGAHLQHLDGVMIGRAAYHQPWLLRAWDAQLFGTPATPTLSLDAVEQAMRDYMEQVAQTEGVAWYAVARHMLGLRHGKAGARRWRQVWSDHRLKALPARAVWERAQAALHGCPSAV